MLKESILLVASTGMLVYVFAPSEPPPAPEPAKVEVQKKVEPLVPPSEESWNNEDAGDEVFTFGEPVAFEDGEADPIQPGQLQPAGTVPPARSRSSSGGNNNPVATSRPPGSPGTMENPMAAPPTEPPPPGGS
ncbi:MAG: hypothetical protein COA41_02830 [Sphingopyxis sp.]|nr:MAG: hypothetical protein COA41_02830 [Sphingopyxis sp.]